MEKREQDTKTPVPIMRVIAVIFELRFLCKISFPFSFTQRHDSPHIYFHIAINRNLIPVNIFRGEKKLKLTQQMQIEYEMLK